jgi:formylglycine-generating enzyme required for sulfatase activity
MIRIVAASLALVCLLVGLQAYAEVSANRHGVAVIIGNKAYPGRTPDAEYAHNDAAAMKKFVINRLGYRPGNIIDLRDATKGQMEAVFGTEKAYKGKLFNWLRPDKSDVVVFYSGHGVPGLQDRRGYLLPVDGDPNLAEITGFPVDRLYANLAKLPARSVTVFLDACFSGETPKGMLVRAASGLTVTSRAPETARALTVITAAQGDQFASWDEDAKHGLFTRHLLLALGGKADGSAYGNGDGKVSLDEAKKYLDEEMTYQARRRFGREQVASVQGGGGVVLASYDPQQKISIAPPSVQVEEVDASYVAIKTASLRAEPTTASTRIGKIARDEAVSVTGKVRGGKWLRVERADGGSGYVFGTLLANADEAEIAAWGQVKDAKTVDEVAAFLRRYPAGYFATRARQLQAALVPQVASIIPPKISAPKPVKPAVGVYPKRYRPGDTFKDCDECPEMVVIGPGQFRMGDLSGDGGSDEKPVHDVRIDYSFAVGKFEVTQAQWRAMMGDNPSYFKGDARPVEEMGWDDVKAFVGALSRKTGKDYRLLSEAEWEYVARAGTTTKYHWGDGFSASKLARGSETEPVGSYGANAFGLYDVHGNVWEWVEDCWHDSYLGAPADGSAWTNGGDCSRHILRGGSWSYIPRGLRVAIRNSFGTEYRLSYGGFRVARPLSSKKFSEPTNQPEVINRKRVASIIPPKIAAPEPVKPVVGVYPKRYRPGDVFKDCDDCPEMVVIPPGQFRMGDLSGDGVDSLSGDGEANEKPAHDVRINYSMAVGMFEVTQAQWQALMGNNPSRFRSVSRPVESVSWNSIKIFLDRLSIKSSKEYRLLSEAEWEYVARAGTTTTFSTGDEIASFQANFYGSRGKTVRVGNFRPNAFGLYDVHGNVAEWVEDCWHHDYEGAPSDGSPWTDGGDCRDRVNRGGSWALNNKYLRSADREANGTRFWRNYIGFRVARTLSR